MSIAKIIAPLTGAKRDKRALEDRVRRSETFQCPCGRRSLSCRRSAPCRYLYGRAVFADVDPGRSSIAAEK